MSFSVVLHEVIFVVFAENTISTRGVTVRNGDVLKAAMQVGIYPAEESGAAIFKTAVALNWEDGVGAIVFGDV